MRAEHVSADLSKLSDIENLHQAVVKLYPEGVDILVNNTGLCGRMKGNVLFNDALTHSTHFIYGYMA